MSIFGGGGSGVGRVIKLFDPDDNKYTMDLKLKIETEKAMIRKHEHDLESVEVNLNGVRNNIAIVQRALDFLKSDEAKIVLMTEFMSYRQAMPKLLKDETELMNAVVLITNEIKAGNAKIADMEESIVRLKTRVYCPSFWRKDEERCQD